MLGPARAGKPLATFGLRGAPTLRQRDKKAFFQACLIRIRVLGLLRCW